MLIGGKMDLNGIFEPRRVAVIGVSLSSPFHPANIVFNKNYYGYEAEVFAINPRGGELERRPVYKSVREIPAQVDQAVVAVKAKLVPEIARECGEAGVRSLVVLSGGFAETGTSEGIALQKELVDICTENSIALVGPNCLGIYSPPYANSLFLPPERTTLPEKGDIAVASQSGAFLVDQILTRFRESGVGISVGVSIGNKAMIDEVDMLEYFAQREDTKAMVFYIEGMDKRARDFVDKASEVARQKPVIVYVGGKSNKGMEAAKSHTAAMAGNIRIMSAALKQKGIIEAESESEITSFAKIFSYYRHRPLRRGNVTIISSSGGHGVITADLAIKAGLNVPYFTEERMEALRAIVEDPIKDISSFQNPVDLTGSASDQDFERVLDYLLEQDDVEGTIILALPYTPLVTSFIGTRLGQVVRRHGKPVVAYVPNLAKYGMVLEGFELNGIPVVHSIEAAVEMLKALRMLAVYCTRDAC
jgi:acyl-CoA synthetase (NDP forming)